VALARLLAARLPKVRWLTLKTAAITLACVLATCAVVVPAASADSCTVTVVLLTGQTQTFVVEEPPGTPTSQMIPAGMQVQSASASCSPDATTSTSSATPHLVDLTGTLSFGPGTDALGALIVYGRQGLPVGRFVDDTTANEATVVTEEYAAGVGLIIAAIPPGKPHLRFAHALNAQEWYPYNSGYDSHSWGPMPRARAYIIQWQFSFAGPPPTARQRSKLLHQAERRHPAMIIGF
jgi:hypothetical protein